jgi:hypothetical protein
MRLVLEDPDPRLLAFARYARDFRAALQGLIDNAGCLDELGGIRFLESGPLKMGTEDAQRLMDTFSGKNDTMPTILLFIKITERLRMVTES